MVIDKVVEPVLIAYVKNKRLQFCAETFADIVSKAGGRPVSIVSVNDPNSEHKNFILGQCLRYIHNYDHNNCEDTPYQWKRTTASEVRGLYLSPEPVLMQKSHQEIAVLLMEPNFYFDETSATREDLMLFALVVMLSSTIIHSIGPELSESLIDFFKLFDRYAKLGISPELRHSYVDLVLVFKDWPQRQAKHYPFGYHDSSTCPLNVDRMYNFRTDRIRVHGADEIAFKNKFFVDTFHRISFCLMPAKDQKDIRDRPLPTFQEVFAGLAGSLFHPSHISVKKAFDRKMSGHQMTELFRRIKAVVDNSAVGIDREFGAVVRDVTALSSGQHFYKFQMNQLIDDQKYLEDKDLDYIHKECRDNSLELKNKMKGQSKRNRFDDLFDKEVDNMWQLYRRLNQYKRQTLKTKGWHRETVDAMALHVSLQKKLFDGQRTALDAEVSRLVGIDLIGVTEAVATATGHQW